MFTPAQQIHPHQKRERPRFCVFNRIMVHAQREQNKMALSISGRRRGTSSSSDNSKQKYYGQDHSTKVPYLVTLLRQLEVQSGPWMMWMQSLLPRTSRGRHCCGIFGMMPPSEISQQQGRSSKPNEELWIFLFNRSRLWLGVFTVARAFRCTFFSGHTRASSIRRIPNFKQRCTAPHLKLL